MSPPPPPPPPLAPPQPVLVQATNLASDARVRNTTKPAPEFGTHFPTSSIGIENELSGLIVAMPANSSQKFGYVKNAKGEALFMLTKDMNQGSYHCPPHLKNGRDYTGWQTHTIELITYPCAMDDEKAVEDRKAGMLWLAKYFTSHISQFNHQTLAATSSDDGQFILEISNVNHIIAAGNGVAADYQGQTISMTPSGQQVTVGVSAKLFGTGANAESKSLGDSSVQSFGYLN
nr:actin cross-linking domain-containing toxin [Vibrio ordalii]